MSTTMLTSFMFLMWKLQKHQLSQSVILEEKLTIDVEAAYVFERSGFLRHVTGTGWAPSFHL
jgi:hypothetical protein